MRAHRRLCGLRNRKKLLSVPHKIYSHTLTSNWSHNSFISMKANFVKTFHSRYTKPNIHLLLCNQNRIYEVLDSPANWNWWVAQHLNFWKELLFRNVPRFSLMDVVAGVVSCNDDILYIDAVQMPDLGSRAVNIEFIFMQRRTNTTHTLVNDVIKCYCWRITFFFCWTKPKKCNYIFIKIIQHLRH